MPGDPIDKWWSHLPERPWPLWVYVLDAVLIAMLAYIWTVYEGVLGIVLGLMFVLLVALPLFLTWQWMSWRESRARR
jgi:hypothetical protein